MGFGSSLKKIAKGAAVLNPVTAFSTLAPVAGGIALGGAFDQKQMQAPQYDPYGDRNEYNLLGEDAQKKRSELGQTQRKQIETFAGDQAKRAADYRASLAKSLADTSANTFKSMNPAILEDLNSRGLFTSQTARDQEQGRLLSDLANEQNKQLTAFDTSVFGDQQDLFGSGLEAMLGGDQAGLDSALAARQAGLTRQFNNADTFREQSFAAKLANKQSKDQLLQSILGLGGQLGSAYLKKGA